MNFHNKSINPFRPQKLIRPIQPFLLQALLVSSSHIFLTFLSMLTFLFADKPASSTSKIDASLAPMSQPEFDTIRHACDTISNTVILDLINEDADSSETSYRNSLHHQILDGCTSLRVNLISINRLMECFNKSIMIACNSTSSSGSAGSQVD